MFRLIFSFLLELVEPNWDYFVNAPLDKGVVRFETKTERALYAKVVASEANWMESQSYTGDRLPKAIIEESV